MSHASSAVALVAFVVGMAVFALVYCAVTVNWRQRKPLLWILVPLAGGIGIGLFKGESLDMILFSLGGGMALLSLMLLFPWGRRKELNRRKAAGEKIDSKEYEPPSWVVWVLLIGIMAWIGLSFALFGG